MIIFKNVLIVIVILAVGVNLYSVYDNTFFYTIFSKVVNITTTVTLFIYLLLYIIRYRNKNNIKNL